MYNPQTVLNYEDVVLDEPRFSNIKTRKECNTSIKFGPHTFNIPVIPANMRCVINNEIGYQLMQHGYFHIMHRFDDVYKSHLEYLDLFDILDAAEPYVYSSVSIGVKDIDFKTVDKLRSTKPDYITVDIAHGHSYAALKMVEYLKTLDWGSGFWKPFVIAGNVATPQAVKDLENAGADAVKVGIGPGKACTTYRQTGFMSPMFTTVQRCAEVATKPIIADGGVREIGDISKALVAGATMVMVGSLFSACIDSPAKTVVPRFNWKNIKADIKTGFYHNSRYIPPVYYKEYYGSASEYNKGHNRNIEGTLITLEGNGLTILEKMDRIQQGLQSSISYMGGKDLSVFNGYPYSVIR